MILHGAESFFNCIKHAFNARDRFKCFQRSLLIAASVVEERVISAEKVPCSEPQCCR